MIFTPTILFYIILAFIAINFLINKYLDTLNAKRFDDAIPQELADIYDVEAYQKSQSYKKVNFKFNQLSSTFMFLVTIVFFLIDGFKIIDTIARSISTHPTVISLLFFGIMMLGLDIISTPFAYYKTFVIEEQFDFNKTTKKLFWLDKLKGWLLSIILGGSILTAFIWFYQKTGVNFWIYAWLLITVFSLLMNMFYAQLIVPLFNKQTPLEEGDLKDAIYKYASKVGFQLQNVFVIDGSKRSTKANAYFSGFGKQKRITLYDTLLTNLTTEETVAVLAHEVGHYKKNHIIYNLILSTLLTGFTLYILSLFIDSPLLSQALGVDEPSFHIGLIAFSILYSPLSEITGILMNLVSRKFEYQADDFAKTTFNATPLITSLKKLSKNSLSNLTPHPAYVFMHYSHPTLLQRIKKLST